MGVREKLGKNLKNKFKQQNLLQEKEEVDEEKLAKLLHQEVISDSDDSSVDGDEKPDQDAQVVRSKWTNRTRVLLFCSRGTDFRTRHLLKDLHTLMPHSKSEPKFDKTATLSVINEIAEMKNCQKVLYFENRKRKDRYLWMSNIENGPSMKFLVHNIHTMDELKLTGNCLKASRPILSFDSTFEGKPHLELIKQTLTQVFSTPEHHPRSQPFVDHVFTFSISPDEKIWFRNFQIVDETLQLQEIGPRFVLELIRIFNGSFEGAVLYDNPNYEAPNDKRRMLKIVNQNKYVNKKLHEKVQVEKDISTKAVLKEKVEDPAGEIFNAVPSDEAAKLVAAKMDKNLKKRKATSNGKQKLKKKKAVPEC